MQQLEYIFFLGSNSALSATEVWRVLMANGYEPAVTAASSIYLVVTVNHELDPKIQNLLGGTDRIGRVLAKIDHEPSSEDLGELLSPTLLDSGKISVGISIVNDPETLNKHVALDLKRWAKKHGGRLRFIIPKKKSARLNSAQVIFNDLTTPPNRELTILKHDATWIVTDTITIQNIQAYELRDTLRPARDPYVGMLPPKLAQIIINLATPDNTNKAQHIYDPFCGMGTVLQEGWLMGYKTTGSDISPKMVLASQENMDWIAKHFQPDPTITPKVLQLDAQQPFPETFKEQFSAIVTEPLLGKPTSKPLPPEAIQHRINEILPLYTTALTYLRPLLEQGGRIVFLLPAFRLEGGNQGFSHLPDSFLDDVSRLGYSKEHLVPDALREWYTETDRGTVVYARPNAAIGREVTIWQKI